jgi:uncharacterized protein involved in exopolysaccharide biosynthesis
MTGPEVEGLRRQLVQLESKLLDLRTKDPEDHQQTRLVKIQIDGLTLSLGGALRGSVNSTPSPSAVPAAERVSFSDRFITLTATYQSLLARGEALQKQAEMLRQDLKGLSAMEAQYARLLGEAESQRTLFDLLSDKLTAARRREQREMRVITVNDDSSHAVTVIDAARPLPVRNETRMIALTIAFGVALGVGALAAGAREARLWATA